MHKDLLIFETDFEKMVENLPGMVNTKKFRKYVMESKKTATQGTLEELDILDLPSKKRSNILAFSSPTKDYKVRFQSTFFIKKCYFSHLFDK